MNTDSPSSRTHAKPIAAATVVFAGYTAVMMRLERHMRVAGGPGIVAFELAGTAGRAEAIMGRWGPRSSSL